jgi:hypothetical protein
VVHVQYILATDGQPFRDRDAAAIKRELLSAQLGASAALDVVDHPHGGYAVRFSSANAITSVPVLAARRAEAKPKSQAQPAAAPSEGDYPETFILHPAPRAFVGQHIQALVGLFLIMQPHRAYQLTTLGFPDNPKLGALLLGTIALAGTLLALMSVTRFLWAFAANTYRIDRDGIEQTQWYFHGWRLRRRTPRVNFSHLRAADVEQTVMQMLLGVGTLRLASGGTDYYEIELRNVRAPRVLQAEVQRRVHQFTASLSAGLRA